MFSPSKEEFIQLAKHGNLIPVYKEIPGDLETPVSVFLKLSRGSDYGYLLESVEGQERIARFSFVGVEPQAILKVKGKRLEIITRNKKGVLRESVVVETEDPFLEIKNFMSRFTIVKTNSSLRFCGGLVGYIGYDMVRFFEKIPDKNPDPLGIPDCLFMLTDTLAMFDHYHHKLKIISCAFMETADIIAVTRAYTQALKRIEGLIKKLKACVREESIVARKKAEVRYCSSRRAFTRMVQKAKKYITKGDIIQVVLSQVLTAKITRKPFDIYRSLRSLNPSAYMFYLKFKALHLVGSSPEMLVRCEDGLVATRPIAGTRPRGKTEAEDLLLERELLGDNKEKAEHIMLVDLGRNDLGRVCKFGSVRLSEFMRIERYSHVMHIVSEVQGSLNRGKDSFDVLRAAFPAGTVSGSPKVRAMEIIDELESSRRGPYAGAVGYFGFSGNLDTCITIRTMVIHKDTAYIQAGAGIVADSVAHREYQETLNKAKAQLEAL